MLFLTLLFQADSLLKKKHVAIAYHRTREAAAAGIVHPIKIDGKNNFADILTKAVTGKTFWALYGKLTRSSFERCSKDEI